MLLDRNFIFPKTIREWNQLLPGMVGAESMEEFRKIVQTHVNSA